MGSNTLVTPSSQSGRIPSLDGLRAVSILLVILSHTAATHGSPIPDNARWYFQQAAVGVDVFFAISGLLITTLLLRERERSGTISLRGFYFRRALRILPAFALYLAALAVFQQFGLVNLIPRDWAAACTYTVNFFKGISRPVGHIWSLSVEEHFYLLWPLLLLLLNTRRAAVLALAVLAAEPAVRWLTYRTAGHLFEVDFVTFARLDALAVGCLLALAPKLETGRRLLSRLDARAGLCFVGSIAVLVLSCLVLGQSGKYSIVFKPWVNAIAIGLAIRAAVACPHAWFGRILNLRGLAWLGGISYSLYLWQQVFLDPTRGQHWMCCFPQNLALALSAAIASHYLIERPFLRLKDRGLGRTPARPPTADDAVLRAGPVRRHAPSSRPSRPEPVGAGRD